MPPRARFLEGQPPLPNMPLPPRELSVVVPSLEYILEGRRTAEAETALPEMPAEVTEEHVATARYEPARRRAFGSAPNLIQRDIDPTVEVEPRHIAALQPANLRAALYGRGAKVVDGVALNVHEYKAIVLNIPTYVEKAVAGTEKKHQLSNPIRAEEASLCARIGVLDRLDASHNTALEGLRSDWNLVHKVRGFARQPGYSRADELTMRALVTAAWNGPIANMLKVVGAQQKWSADDQRAVDEALLRSLLYAPHNARLGNWRNILSVTEEYIGEKGVVFNGRSTSINLRRTDLQNKLAAFYEKNGLLPV